MSSPIRLLAQCTVTPQTTCNLVSGFVQYCSKLGFYGLDYHIFVLRVDNAFSSVTVGSDKV